MFKSMKLTKYGRREWLGLGLAALALLALCAIVALVGETAGIYLGILVAATWLAVAAFFRDPERLVPSDASAIVSPADGVVKDIELIRGDDEDFNALFQGRDVLRIGIFLSVLDVHLNRTPCDMKLRFKKYKEGAYHDARDAKAIKENESLLIGGDGSAGALSFPVAVRQISGAIARRIVCEPEPGDSLSKGQRYGMIKFGSRTELFLPAKSDIEICVKVGERVFGASSIMARVSQRTADGDSPAAS